MRTRYGKTLHSSNFHRIFELFPFQALFKRMACNSSGITFVDLVCDFKSVSRIKQILNYGVKNIVPITEDWMVGPIRKDFRVLY